MKAIPITSILLFAVFFTSCESVPNVTPGMVCEENTIIPTKTDSKIVFISRRIENSSKWMLYSMNPDGTEQKEITNLTVQYQRVSVSHSGQKVLFVHYSDDHIYQLYSINVDGTNLNLIDQSNRYCGSPDWSADDSKIIYSKSKDGSVDETDLILYELSSGNRQTLVNTGNNIMGRFSIDNKIALWRQTDGSNDIFQMNIDGSDLHKILDDAIYPAWSPGGKRIAYVSQKGITNSPQIFVACSDGSNVKQLTTTYLTNWDSGFPDFGNFAPQWTPDGQKIVYVSEVNDGMPEIYIMNDDGTNPVRLTNTERRNEEPTVSSDGTSIIFVSNRDLTNGFDIFTMDIDGENQLQLSKYSNDDAAPVLVCEQ